jgi:hypothetical protein
MTTAWIRSTGNCDSCAIIALGFSPVNGAPYQGPVFAIPLAPSGAKRHSLRDDDWRHRLAVAVLKVALGQRSGSIPRLRSLTETSGRKETCDLPQSISRHPDRAPRRASTTLLSVLETVAFERLNSVAAHANERVSATFEDRQPFKIRQFQLPVQIWKR